jgi:hypothetical protein
MADEPRHLSELLAAGSIRALQREAERRRTETAAIRALLPPEEGSHLLSAVTNEVGELVLVVDTPSWAARMRFCVSALPTQRVKIKVSPRGGG